MQAMMILRMAGVSMPPQLIREPYERGYRGPEPIGVSVSAHGPGVKAPTAATVYFWETFFGGFYGVTVNGIDASVFSQTSASVPWLPPLDRRSILNVSTGVSSVFKFIFVRPKSRDGS